MSEALDPEGRRRARAVSQWNLGSPGWADAILAAYFDPDDADAAEALDELGGGSEDE